MILILYCRYSGKKCLRDYFCAIYNKVRQGDTIDYIIISVFLLLTLYIIGHNSLFFDSTWDAHTYQVPRIELFVQKKSLFVNMRSEAINIFCNEWNGELNAVFYAILCGTNQGMFLANAENFFYTLLVVFWFCRKIGITKSNTYIALIGYCGMPVVIFLAMVVKGDFVVIPFFLATIIWLKDYIELQSTYSLFFLIISGALAAGSKISMVPFLGLCFVSVFVYLIVKNRGNFSKIFRYVVGIWKMLLLGIVCVIISCSRYVLNYFFFGEFFKRVEVANEKVIISWKYLETSAVEILKTLIESDNMFTQEGSVYALGVDMGIVGSVFGILFLPTTVVWIYNNWKRRNKIKKEWFYVWFPVVGSMMFLMAGTMWQPWSFRYYIAWGLALFFYWILMLQEIFNDLPKCALKLAATAGIWLGITGLVSTIVLTTRGGEVTHGSWKEAYQRPIIEREYGYHPYLLENKDGSADIYDFFDQIKSGRKVLICNSINTAVSYLFGEDNSNDITFCLPTELASILSGEREYDVVSVSDVFLTPELEAFFGDGGWECYMPANDILHSHVFIAEQMQYTK